MNEKPANHGNVCVFWTKWEERKPLRADARPNGVTLFRLDDVCSCARPAWRLKLKCAPMRWCCNFSPDGNSSELQRLYAAQINRISFERLKTAAAPVWVLLFG